MKTAEDIIKEKKQKMIFVDKETTIHDTVQIMLKNKIGAMLIKENDEIIGIWTERDLLKDVVKENFDLKTAKIGDHMTTDLKSAKHDSMIYHLKDQFLGLRIRHLLIEKDGKYIGILSAGDATRASLNRMATEIKELNSIASWEYYEDWKWNPK